MKTTLGSDGQIQLSQEIQAQLGLKPGDDVILETQNGTCIIRASDAATGLMRQGNVLVHRGVSESSIDAVLEEIHNQRLDQATEGMAP